MTDIIKRDKIIACFSFVFSAIVLSYQEFSRFSLIYFAVIGLVLLFADKVFDNEKIKEKTLCAFILTAISHQTFYQIFSTVHESNQQLMTASACAIFIAAAFAMTDKNKTAYSIVAAPLLCFLDLRIGICFGLLLFTASFSSFISEEGKFLSKATSDKGAKKKPKTNNNKSTSDIASLNPKLLFAFAALTGLICFAVCIYLTYKNSTHSIENYKYLIKHFKHLTGFAILAIYLLIKIFRSNLSKSVKFIAPLSMILCLATGFLLLSFHGWSYFSLISIVCIVYAGLACLNNNEIVESVKEDYNRNKYLFWVLLILIFR